MANPKTPVSIGALVTSSADGLTFENGHWRTATGKAFSLTALMEARRTVQEMYSGSPLGSIAESLGEPCRLASRHPPKMMIESNPNRQMSLSSKSLFGLEIVVEPALDYLEPNIRVRQVHLSDGTPLLSEEFIASENAAWKELHGSHGVAYLMDRRTLAVSHAMKQAIDREVVKVMFDPESP